jgi:cold shock CspA family protein
LRGIIRLKGKVKRWLASQGYGFIESKDLKEDVLVHHLDLTGITDLKEGQIVDFQINAKGPRPRAIEVKIIKEPEKVNTEKDD